MFKDISTAYIEEIVHDNDVHRLLTIEFSFNYFKSTSTPIAYQKDRYVLKRSWILDSGIFYIDQLQLLDTDDLYDSETIISSEVLSIRDDV